MHHTLYLLAQAELPAAQLHIKGRAPMSGGIKRKAEKRTAKEGHERKGRKIKEGEKG